jgi:hypothetical protein
MVMPEGEDSPPAWRPPSLRWATRPYDDVVRRVALFLLGAFGGMVAAAVTARSLIGSRGDEASDELGLVTIMDALDLESRSVAFRGGSVSAWMASVDIDLREALIDPSGAALELVALTSAVTILIPPTWRVSVRARGAAQAITTELDGQDALPPGAPTLAVRLLVVGSAVELSNRPDGHRPA